LTVYIWKNAAQFAYCTEHQYSGSLLFGLETFLKVKLAHSWRARQFSQCVLGEILVNVAKKCSVQAGHVISAAVYSLSSYDVVVVVDLSHFDDISRTCQLCLSAESHSAACSTVGAGAVDGVPQRQSHRCSGLANLHSVGAVP